MNFYLLHYSNESGSKESVVITDQDPTPTSIEENCPFEMTYQRTINCETNDQDLCLLPIDSELTK